MRASSIPFLAIAALAAATTSLAGCGGEGTQAQPFPRGSRIDYVTLGDSSQGAGSRAFREHLERDLGVQVNLMEEVAPGSSSTWWVERLRGDRQLRDELRRAEVITFNVPAAVVSPCISPLLRAPAAFRRCMERALTVYRADTQAMLAEIVSLRAPSDALIRATDTWLFGYRLLHELGIYRRVKPYWRQLNDAVVEAGTRHAIPVTRAYEAIMGPSGDDDPIAEGYISGDQFHLTAKGAALLGKLYRDLEA